MRRCMHTNLVGLEGAYILSSLDSKTLVKLHRRQTCPSVCCSHIYVIIYKYLANLHVKCETTKTYLNQMETQKSSIKWSLL